MTRDKDIERLMKRCQIGFCGSNALEQAHDCAADCYRMLGRLRTDRQKLGQALLWLTEIYEHEQEPMPTRPDWLREALGIYRSFSADG